MLTQNADMLSYLTLYTKINFKFAFKYLKDVTKLSYFKISNLLIRTFCVLNNIYKQELSKNIIKVCKILKCKKLIINNTNVRNITTNKKKTSVTSLKDKLEAKSF